MEVVEEICLLDFRAAAAEVEEDVADVFVGHGEFQVHDGLEHHGRGGFDGFFKRGRGRAGDGDVGSERVVKIGDAGDDGLEAEEGVSLGRAGAAADLDGFAHGLDERQRDLFAVEGGVDLEVEGIQRRDLYFDRGLVAAFADFTIECADTGSRLGDALAIPDTGLADADVELAFAEQAVLDDLEMELAHAAEDGLAGLVVHFDLEGGIVEGHLFEGLFQIWLIGRALRLDGEADDGLREGNALEEHLLFVVAEGVAGHAGTEADDADDVSGAYFGDLFAFVRKDAPEFVGALGLFAARVVDAGPGLERAGIDPEECQRAVVIGVRFEDEPGKRAAGVRFALDLLVLILRVMPDCRGDFER